MCYTLILITSHRQNGKAANVVKLMSLMNIATGYVYLIQQHVTVAVLIFAFNTTLNPKHSCKCTGG